MLLVFLCVVGACDLARKSAPHVASGSEMTRPIPTVASVGRRAPKPKGAFPHDLREMPRTLRETPTAVVVQFFFRRVPPLHRVRRGGSAAPHHVQILADPSNAWDNNDHSTSTTPEHFY